MTDRNQRSRDRKLSRDATDDEIFPGRHGPIQSEARDQMLAIMKAVQDVLGDKYEITLFVAEKKAPDGSNREPRFNYASTANREDMYAVIRAWLAKNSEIGEKLEKILGQPETDAKQ
jgi:hypothetical protein